jgi:hypothetical protein
MGVEVGIEVEGGDDLYGAGVDRMDGKMFCDIVLDATDTGETLTAALAEKYGFSLEPMRKLSNEEGEEAGPWQDPLDLWECAYAMFDAFAKEGPALLDKEMGYRPIDALAVTAYLEDLSAAVAVLKYAHENGKRVRLRVC